MVDQKSLFASFLIPRSVGGPWVHLPRPNPFNIEKFNIVTAGPRRTSGRWARVGMELGQEARMSGGRGLGGASRDWHSRTSPLVHRRCSGTPPPPLSHPLTLPRPFPLPHKQQLQPLIPKSNFSLDVYLLEANYGTNWRKTSKSTST
jgi:hypothetical protein